MFFSRSVMFDSLQPHGLQHTRLPVHHYLPQLAQTHVHWFSDAIQSSQPLSSPSPPVIIITSYILLYYKSISPSHARCRHSVNAAVFIFIDIIHIPWNSSSFNCRILAKSTASRFGVWSTTGTRELIGRELSRLGQQPYRKNLRQMNIWMKRSLQFIVP